MTTPEDIMDRDHEAREAALALLSEGEATQSEVASLAGVSRQLVRHWAMQAGIDPGKARASKLAREWRARQTGKRKPRTKKELRATADLAKADWDRR